MGAELWLIQSVHCILPVTVIGSEGAQDFNWTNQTKEPLFIPWQFPQDIDQTALWFLFLLVSLF